jgi:hypothetical protein
MMRRWARLLAAGLLCAVPAHRAIAQQRVSFGHSAAKDIAVRLVGPFAHLTVIGWDRDSISLAGTLPSTFRLDNVFAGDPGVPSRGAKFYIDGSNVIMPKQAWLELRVPAKARIAIKGGTSELVARGLTGDVDLNMIGGTITVDGSPTVLDVEAIDASIRFTGSADWLRLKTGAGEIVMSGQSVDAGFTTVSGNVRVSDATLDRARFESTTGSVTVSGEMARGASWTFDTHSGLIDLRLGGKPSAAIEAVTMAGTIENALTTKRADIGRNGRGQEIDFEVGSGDGRIRITTYKGNVRIAGR